MLRTVELKLYPTDAQAATLRSWMDSACWIYNRALEHRSKAYKRRKESISFYDQSALLTQWRSRISVLADLPARFGRDALRRVDHGFKAFFRRVKSGEKPGYPRFKSRRRWNSLQNLDPDTVIRGTYFLLPRLGGIRFRSGKQSFAGKIKLSRIIQRSSGWFGQILLDDGKEPPKQKVVESTIGIDVGLNAFATLSNGEKVDNPRFGRRSESSLRTANRCTARCIKGSKRHRHSVHRLRRIHERVAAQRRAFCHKHSTDIVRRFDLIGYEKLNVKGMVRGHFAKSIMDAAWSMFTGMIARKAECAGKLSFAVNARKSSQECPWCGAIVPKQLSEREHRCDCRPGIVIDRDEAAGIVIESRAVGLAAASGVEIGPLSSCAMARPSLVCEARESPN